MQRVRRRKYVFNEQSLVERENVAERCAKSEFLTNCTPECKRIRVCPSAFDESQ